MKRSRTGIALIIAGALLVALSPAWFFGIGPLFIKLPANLKVNSAYAGKLTLYADPATSRFYPPGQEVVVPLSIRAKDNGIPSQSDGRVLVVQEHVAVTDSSTGKPLAGVRPDATYAIERKTCQNVPGYLDGVDRTGLTITFPLGAKKTDYLVWDDELGRATACDFKRETKMDGNKYKGVTVYAYELSGEMERMDKPPPGLSNTITGKKLKEISGDLPIADDAEIALQYFKKTDLTQYVEPRTGMVVYAPRHHYEYYVKNAPGASPAFIKLASVDYSGVLADARREIDSAAQYFEPMDMDQKWAPLTFLVLGCAMLIAGVLLTVRSRKRRGRERADDPAEAL